MEGYAHLIVEVRCLCDSMEAEEPMLLSSPFDVRTVVAAELPKSNACSHFA